MFFSERKWEEGQRKREGESQAFSVVSVQEPMCGSISGTMSSRHVPKSRVMALTHGACKHTNYTLKYREQTDGYQREGEWRVWGSRWWGWRGALIMSTGCCMGILNHHMLHMNLILHCMLTDLNLNKKSMYFKCLQMALLAYSPLGIIYSKNYTDKRNS